MMMKKCKKSLPVSNSLESEFIQYTDLPQRRWSGSCWWPNVINASMYSVKNKGLEPSPANTTHSSHTHRNSSSPFQANPWTDPYSFQSSPPPAPPLPLSLAFSFLSSSEAAVGTQSGPPETLHMV